MKIAVTSAGSEEGSAVDPRFGRCRCFLVFDEETGNCTILDNAQNLQSAQGAGIQAAQHLIDAGVEVVLTGNLGPKAFKVLRGSGIKAYSTTDPTAAQALAAFRAGRLREMVEESVESHWV